MKQADILIRNGRIIDCYSQVDEIGDLAILDGVIVDVDEVRGAKQVIDAAGCIVSPGFIDFHVHAAVLASELGISPDSHCFPSGVTTLVDAGTTGIANYELFRALTSYHYVRIKAFLNVCPTGLATVKYPEELNPQYYDSKKILRYLRKYSDQLIGLKVRQSKDIVGELGIRPLLSALEIAEQAGCRVACHTTDAPVPSDELVSYLRPGDVYAHVYHGKGHTIIGNDGHVLSGIIEARKRGVIFDAASGRLHFSFKIAQAALKDSFLPDIISSDLTQNNHWIPGRVFSLPYVISKCMAIGINLIDALRGVTLVPASLLGMGRELGSLLPGTCADITVQSLVDKKVIFEDADSILHGECLLKTQMTIREGVLVYRQIDFM